jgi:hypothetical protein
MLFSPLGPGGPAELLVLMLAHLLFTPFNNATHDLTSSIRITLVKTIIIADMPYLIKEQ